MITEPSTEGSLCPGSKRGLSNWLWIKPALNPNES
jgi:hypothetical protein